jgi:hypothetical protein
MDFSMRHEKFGNLLIRDYTITVNMWRSYPEKKVNPQTLYFKGSFLLSFLIPLPVLLQNHSQEKGLSSALGKCSWVTPGPGDPYGWTMGHSGMCHPRTCSKASRSHVGSHAGDT